MIVAARNSISSNTSGSGQNVIVVPVWPRFDLATTRSLPCGTPGLTFAALLLRRVLLAVGVAVAVDLEHEPRRQRVHDRHADTVQTARHLVAAVAELAARVQRGHHDLGRRPALVLRVLVDRDAAPVVGDAAPAVGEQGDVDPGRVAGHRLVDRRCRRPPTRGGAGPASRSSRCTCRAGVRTGSRPSSTWICSAEYPLEPQISPSSRVSGAGGHGSTVGDAGDAERAFRIAV